MSAVSFFGSSDIGIQGGSVGFSERAKLSDAAKPTVNSASTENGRFEGFRVPVAWFSCLKRGALTPERRSYEVLPSSSKLREESKSSGLTNRFVRFKFSAVALGDLSLKCTRAVSSVG